MFQCAGEKRQIFAPRDDKIKSQFSLLENGSVMVESFIVP